MSKLNGWEYHNCQNTDCPARKAESFDGFNSGKNGGRICWYVKSIALDRKAKGEQAQKCKECGLIRKYPYSHMSSNELC